MAGGNSVSAEHKFKGDRLSLVCAHHVGDGEGEFGIYAKLCNRPRGHPIHRRRWWRRSGGSGV